jgi:hypothetical protein
MSGPIGRFGFEVFGGGSESLSPAIVLVVERWRAEENAPSISPNLMSEREVDEYIASLKADLDRISRRAKAVLRNAGAPILD